MPRYQVIRTMTELTIVVSADNEADAIRLAQTQDDWTWADEERFTAKEVSRDES